MIHDGLAAAHLGGQRDQAADLRLICYQPRDAAGLHEVTKIMAPPLQCQAGRRPISETFDVGLLAVRCARRTLTLFIT